MDTRTAFAIAEQSLTAGTIATRIRAADYGFLGLLLPNPDPVLRQTGKAITVYRDIARDTHVGACIRRRKSAVKALQWGVDRGQAPARVAAAVQDMFAALDMERIIGQMLEATLFGYQPMEIDWRPGARGVWAADVQAKPPEWFCFDPDARLRFRSRVAPLEGELLPERKFLLPRQDASYQNPYGLGDMALCYWPVIFKKGGLRFWLTFAEKFGSAFAVGKLPRGAQKPERDALLADLDALVQTGVAVIPDDGSVELIESAGKSASADLYERLVTHCRGEISIVLTGTNQTVEADSNRASAVAGADVAAALRDGDAEIVAAAVNQLIGWTVDINWPGATAPTFSLWDQKAKDQLQAQREKTNYEAGARFTRSYWIRQYGYLETDLAPDARADMPALPAGAQAAGGNAATVAFAQQQGGAPDPTAEHTDTLAGAAAPAWAALIDQLQAIVGAAPDLVTLQRRLVDAYGGLDAAELAKLMAAAFALAQLEGMAAVADAAG